MEQQADLAVADVPGAATRLRVVFPPGPSTVGRPTPPPLQVPPIRTLFPAPDHVQADRSAIGRAVGLWAATKRAAELSRR
ncbi:MAG TPA: hypothetical protein VFC13_02945, partial [Actinomycetes bacterium]|nr:hypothetical protein [Actinomycetes bacterium]